MLSLRVHSVVAATPTSRVLRLDLGGAAFRFRPGQAVRLGLHGQPIRKPYSIASAPQEVRAAGHLEFLIKTDTDGHIGPHLTGVRRGSLVDVEGPLGSFTFPAAPAERSLLFIAGGAGIAPLRSMLRHALGDGFGGRLHVLYSARSPRHFAYVTELRRLSRQGKIGLTLTVTREASPGWRGDRGRITQRRLASLAIDRATWCFVSGPPAFIAKAVSLLQRLGVSSRRIRMESRKVTYPWRGSRRRRRALPR